MDKREQLFTELAQRLVAVSPDRTIRAAIDGVTALERQNLPMNSAVPSPLWDDQ